MGGDMYNSQNTSFFNAALFGSYIGDRYEASLLYSNNNMKMNENGGVSDDRYITDPQAMASGGKNLWVAKHSNRTEPKRQQQQRLLCISGTAI